MSDETYKIIEVLENAAERNEAMGTKPKFWYMDRVFRQCLFKKNRPNTGEDWSEKISDELCKLLGIPHANYELAKLGNEYGVISLDFRPKGAALVHGNEMLQEIIPGYPSNQKKFYKVSQHTLDSVFRVLEEKNVLPPDQKIDILAKSSDFFVGYLLLDAWIGNTDRHHANWGVLQFTKDNVLRLAPTFDHASSLGRNEEDQKKRERLCSKDKGYTVEAYIEKCCSAFYDKESDTKPMLTYDVFRKACMQNPFAGRYWLDALINADMEEVRTIVGKVPDGRMSEVSKEFTFKMLELNRHRLEKLRKELK